jgi:hypothetical protein
VEALDRELERLLAKRRHHEQRRQASSRELRRRALSQSPLGRALADLILPCLSASEAAGLFAASPAVLSSSCCFCDPGARRRVYHLRSVAPDLPPQMAQTVVARLYWPAVQTILMDLGGHGWGHLLEALWNPWLENEGSRASAPELQLSSLSALSVIFPAERSALCRERWLMVSPLLVNFVQKFGNAPLRELILTNLRSTNVLTAALSFCGRHLAVCRASFLGPESKRGALELPDSGLPELRCFWIHHRDFSEQRASRQDRMRVLARPLLACLRGVRKPENLRVLTLTGVQVDGSAEETASLLQGLLGFTGFAAISLRFSVPGTFGALLPLRALLQMRLAWRDVGAFFLRDTSLHGFDYWPEEHAADLVRLYPRSVKPDPFQVFDNEFRQVLRSQYSTTPERQWSQLLPAERSHWDKVAGDLQDIRLDEVRHRIFQLFPGSF